MKEFFNKIWTAVSGFFLNVWAWLTGVCTPIGEKIGLSAEVTAYILIGVVVALIIVIIMLIAGACSKKRKAKKAAKALEKEKAKQDNLSAKAQAVVEEKHVSEEVVKIDSAPVEQPATVVVTEPTQEEVSASVEVKAVEETPAQEEKVEKPVEKAEVKEDIKVAVKKAPAKKTENKTAKKVATAETVKEDKKPAKKLAGKWKIVIKRDNEYVAELTASNGEVMLISETYSTADGARNGISTIIKGVETGTFVIYRDKAGNYYFKLKSANNRLLCVGAVYKEKTACIKASESVKRIAKDSPIMPDVVEGERYVEYTPAKVTASGKGGKGKWKIEVSEEGGFSAKLYANNGQLMLATEEVSAKKTAKTAIESVKKNCADGNFIIDKDKFGRFYYKLHNAQKSVLCIGEAYDTLDGCVSAIESVRRFAATAELAE
ncbi:MAG: DUF1508 domain-containing protein [Clostridia bacterium]|nr:DUF1508 domain-containing protein [Clostridia bacterium]